MNGFIVIDKPAGITSHDVVSRVRRILGTRKVGHTGTLDPFATGVLPVAVNDGTKVIPFLDEETKCYEALMRLGVSTDTLDMTGKVLAEADFSGIDRERFEAVSKRYIGRISQIPPMYSAIKQNGKPLYKLARQGVEVERQSRDVEIVTLKLFSFEPPFVSLRIHCSRGTYVRTLADDIGSELGCGAALQELRRTASGRFAIAAAVTLEDLEAFWRQGLLESHYITPQNAIDHLDEICLNESGLAKVRHGRSPDYDGIIDFQLSAGADRLVRLSFNDNLVAIALLKLKSEGFAEIVLKRVLVG